jgi:hypothetical protein
MCNLMTQMIVKTDHSSLGLSPVYNATQKHENLKKACDALLRIEPQRLRIFVPVIDTGIPTLKNESDLALNALFLNAGAGENFRHLLHCTPQANMRSIAAAASRYMPQWKDFQSFAINSP